MAKFAKWLGGGLGWAFGGPIGAIVGFALGSLFDSTEIVSGSTTGYEFSDRTTSGDFTISLLVLASSVMKADGKTMQSELEYVRKFLIHNFGVVKANKLVAALGQILKQDFLMFSEKN